VSVQTRRPASLMLLPPPVSASPGVRVPFRVWYGVSTAMSYSMASWVS
jgi:hypothetical protein